MKAYTLSFVRVNDQDTFNKAYVEKAMPIVERYGGVAIAVNESPMTIEGTVPDGRVVIVEFPSRQAAEDFYNDPEYKSIKIERQKVSESDTIIFEKGF